MQDLTYGSVVSALMQAVPECHNTYKAELGWWGAEPPPPDPYTVLGFALRPLLTQLSKDKVDENIFRRIFGFFEQMAKSNDIQVVNLLQVSELEFLVGEPDLLSRAWKYMGERTKALARKTAKIWKCEQNLPK